MGLVRCIQINGIIEGVEVRKTVRIPCLTQKLRRIENENHDHRKNGDNADNDKELDKGESGAETFIYYHILICFPIKSLYHAYFCELYSAITSAGLSTRL